MASVAFETSVVPHRPERASRPTGMRTESGFAALVDEESRPEPKPAAQTRMQPRDQANPAEPGEPASATAAPAPGEAAPETAGPAPVPSELAPPPHGTAPTLHETAPTVAAPAAGAQAPAADAAARTSTEAAPASSEVAASANGTAEAVDEASAAAVIDVVPGVATPAQPAAVPVAASSVAVEASVPAPVTAPVPPAGETQPVSLQPVHPAPAAPAAVLPASADTSAAPDANGVPPAQGEAVAPAIKAAAPATAESAGGTATETSGTAPARSGAQTAAPTQPDAPAQPKQVQAPAASTGPRTGTDTPGLPHDLAVAPDDAGGATAKPTAEPVLHLLTPAPAHAASAQATMPQAAPVSAAQPVPVNALAIEIASQARAGNSRFEIRLDPPELGRIDVRLDIDRDGNVTSRLVIERSDTYDLLRRDQSTLERALQQAGLKTSDNALEFSLRDQGFAQQRDADDRPRGVAALIQDSDVPPGEAASGYARLLAARGGIDIRV